MFRRSEKVVYRDPDAMQFLRIYDNLVFQQPQADHSLGAKQRALWRSGCVVVKQEVIQQQRMTFV